MRGTISRTLNKKTRKDTQIKLYKAMAVPTFAYGSEIWTLTKKQEARIETAEINFLRSVAGYKRIEQINSKIREELNIFNLNNKILNFRSQCFMNGRWKNSKENYNIQPKRKKGYRMSTVKMEGPVHSSRGQDGPNMA
jgi:hypothetical protein